MFQLHRISLNNFRTFEGKHEFEFPTKAGLYFFTGVNKAQPSLGANGAGKSTFLDALSWVLFGRTTRGLKANEIITWDGPTSASVELELTVGDRRATIKRSQKPNALLLDGKAVDQEELQKYIRLNFDAFRYSVLNPQFTTSFFALSSTEKLVLFSNLMELDFWIEKSKVAGKQADKIQIKIDDLTAVVNRYHGQIETVQEDIVELTTLAAEYESTRDAKAANLKAEAVEAYKGLRASEKAAKELNTKRHAVHDDLDKKEQELLDLEKTRQIKLNIVSAMTAKNKELNKEKAEIQAQIRMVENTSFCTACLQQVSRQHAAQRIVSLKKNITVLDKNIKQTTEHLLDATGSIAKFRMKIMSVQNECADFKNELKVIEAKYQKHRIKISGTNQRLDDIANRLDETETEKNPHKISLSDKQAKLTELEQQLAEANDKRATLESEHEAVRFWVKGFKRVRLFIIERAFETLEVEVNNSLAQLGMTDWQITFDVERENKSGGITKGFVVFIKGPKNTEPVRWENWSGGETQRLQLAGDLGLANLIMQKAGLFNSIEFFDEPSTHLSSEGMIDLANMLHQRAIEEGKCIWIVDHAAITNFGEFEGIITARKDENGSTISRS